VRDAGVPVVDFLPVGYPLGLLAIRTTARRQRVGGVAAGTVVVERDAAAPAVGMADV
jgi:uncharacterized RDD family membrane protein YckC